MNINSVKKKIGTVFCIFLSLLSYSARATENYSVTDLYEQAANGWHKSYESHGRTIDVDIDIEVPDVDTLPVIKVVYDQPFSEDKITAQYDDGDDKLYYLIRPTGSLFMRYNFMTYEPRNDKERKYRGYTVEELDPKQDLDTYFFNNPITASEAIDFIEEKLYQFSGNTYDMSLFRLRIQTPMRLRDPKTEELGEFVRDVGRYVITLRQVLNGIPFNVGIAMAFKTPEVSTREPVLWYPFEAESYIISKDEYRINAQFAKQTELVYEDMPVCSVDKVIESCEKAIEKGNIRQIYGMRLGYVVYLDPKTDDYFWAVPSWVVECRYVKSPKVNEFDEHLEGLFTQKTAYANLVVNAQTGELINPFDQSKDRSYAPKIKTW